MISIEKDLHLPDALRAELRKAFGRVLESSEIIDLLKNKNLDKPLITVGDTVSVALIKGGLFPSLIVWDAKVKREPSDEGSILILSEYAPAVGVKNPPAIITQEAWDLVSSLLKEKKASVRVDGEEDLLAIPAILNSDEGSYVIYGLPNKGAILILVDRKIKAVFQDILSRFI